MQLVIWVVTFIAMLALTLFIRYSRMGRACRACAEDLKMASLLGINTDRVIALTFVIGAAMAAVAGVLLGQFYGVINPYIGFMAVSYTHLDVYKRQLFLQTDQHQVTH